MVTLLCTVRRCGLPLMRHERSFVCANRHSFDIARSGYVNLLQPQDRRSAEPGDRREAVDARRRLFDFGFGRALREALRRSIESMQPSTVLDVGCGEGSHLGALREEFGFEAHGIDLSTHAIDLAARRHPDATWVVANADRFLPSADASFDVALSITARRPSSELRRVVRADGQLLVVIPAADDLIELREAVQGEAIERSRVEGVIAELAADFTPVSQTFSREQVELGRSQLQDLLDSTYRGARHSQSEALTAIEAMRVTNSYDLLLFRPLEAGR